METNWFKEVSFFSVTYNDGDDVWFVGENYSLLFKMSLKGNQLKNVIRIEDEDFETFRKYWRLQRIGSKLFLIPHASDRIAVFHTDKNVFSFIYLEKTLSNCLSCVRVNENLYLISESEIVIVDIRKEKIVEYIPIPDYGKLVSEVALLVNGHILIPLIFQTGVIDFCIDEKRFSYFQLEGKISGFVTGVVDGINVWLAGDKGSIIQWNYGTNQTISYDVAPDGFDSYNYDEKGNFIPWGSGWTSGVSFQYWYQCALLCDTVWFIPAYSNSLLYIDKKSQTLQKYTLEAENKTSPIMEHYGYVEFLLVGVYKNRYIKIYSTKRDVIYNIDVLQLTHKVEFMSISSNISLDFVRKEYLGCIEKKSVQHGIKENSHISMLDMLEFLNGKTTSVMNHQIGASIYENVKADMEVNN